MWQLSCGWLDWHWPTSYRVLQTRYGKSELLLAFKEHYEKQLIFKGTCKHVLHSVVDEAVLHPGSHLIPTVTL